VVDKRRRSGAGDFFERSSLVESGRGPNGHHKRKPPECRNWRGVTVLSEGTRLHYRRERQMRTKVLVRTIFAIRRTSRCAPAAGPQGQLNEGQGGGGKVAAGHKKGARPLER